MVRSATSTGVVMSIPNTIRFIMNTIPIDPALAHNYESWHNLCIHETIGTIPAIVIVLSMYWHNNYYNSQLLCSCVQSQDSSEEYIIQY